MKKLLFKKNMDPSCSYCCFSTAKDNHKKIVICSKKGAVAADSSCNKFKYDPLKRVPKTKKIAESFSPEDFVL